MQKTFWASLALVVTLFGTVSFAQQGSMPDRFFQVNDWIFRGARPTADDLATLKEQYQIRTIVDLEDSDEMIASEKAAAEKLGMNFVSIRISGFVTPDDRDINQALDEMVRGQSAGHVFVHCKHGRDRTGLVVGLYRVLEQHWTKKVAYQEMADRGFRTFWLPLRNYFFNRTAAFSERP